MKRRRNGVSEAKVAVLGAAALPNLTQTSLKDHFRAIKPRHANKENDNHLGRNLKYTVKLKSQRSAAAYSRS